MFNKVKFIKLIIITVLLMIVTVIPGELYQGYLDQYNDFYKTSFYLPDRVSPDKMIGDLSETASKYGLHIFKIYERDKKTFSVSLDIYADDEMLDILKKDYGIAKGEYKSIFSGKADIKAYDFSDISEELLKQDKTYYLYGDSEAMIHFKEDLVDTYAGSFPKNDGFNDLGTYLSLLVLAWVFAIVIIVLLGIYDTTNQKREGFVRLTMGERIGFIFLKNIMIDTGYMILIFGVLRIAVKNIEGELVFDSYSNLMFFLTILINILITFRITKVDFKEAVADRASSKSVLSYNYLLCGICMVLFIASMSSFVELIYTDYRYSIQEDYFKEYSKYNWYQALKIENDSEDEIGYDSEQNLQNLLNEFMEENADSVFYLCQGFEYDEDSGSCIYEASSGAKEYLQSQIPELRAELDCEDYILIHEGSKISDSDLDNITDWLDTENYQFLYYSETANIIYRIFDEDPITEMVRNPVILFHNKGSDSVASDELRYEFFLCMIDTKTSGWTEYAKEHNISYIETNAWDYYCYRWESLSRTILVNAVIVIIMFIMQMIISGVVIKMEFQVNAKELALKKLHGYHIFERFGTLYMMSGIISVLAFVTMVIMKLIEIEIGIKLNLWYAVISLLLILCMEFIYTTWQIVLNEKRNLPIIFKGGSI